MEITLIGIIVILSGFVFFISHRKYLLYAFVASVPFSAAAVVNIRPITFGLQPSYFFMILLITRRFMDASMKRSKIRGSKKKENLCLMLFLLFTTLSLAMPILISGSELAHRPSSSFGAPTFEPVKLTRLNITQLLYILFVGLSFFTMTSEITNFSILKTVLKIYIFTALFVSLWGVYQLANFQYGIPYFNLFNNSISVSQGYDVVVAGVKKLSSVAPEPSLLSIYLLSILPLLLTFSLYKSSICRKRTVQAIGVVTLFIALLSTSTAMYLGLIILGILSVSLLTLRSHSVLSLIKKGGLFLCLLGLAFISASWIFNAISNINFVDYVIGTTTAKVLLSNPSEHAYWSGYTRWNSFLYGMKWFAKYPILGLGIGSVTSTSILSNLLASIGLLGTVPFLAFNYIIFTKGFKLYSFTAFPELSNIGLGLLISQICLIAVMILATSIAGLIVFSYWFIVAMISASYEIATNKSRVLAGKWNGKLKTYIG